ncbi:MAG TPA: hypothetical protein VEI95_13320, partial [Acidobacteriota bacterium]|nr:hypothetical protein [Acidobacteriota bacterium]
GRKGRRDGRTVSRFHEKNRRGFERVTNVSVFDMSKARMKLPVQAVDEETLGQMMTTRCLGQQKIPNQTSKADPVTLG